MLTFLYRRGTKRKKTKPQALLPVSRKTRVVKVTKWDYSLLPSLLSDFYRGLDNRTEFFIEFSMKILCRKEYNYLHKSLFDLHSNFNGNHSLILVEMKFIKRHSTFIGKTNKPKHNDKFPTCHCQKLL